MAKNYESESKNSRNYTDTTSKNSYGNEMNHTDNARSKNETVCSNGKKLFFFYGIRPLSALIKLGRIILHRIPVFEFKVIGGHIDALRLSGIDGSQPLFLCLVGKCL